MSKPRILVCSESSKISSGFGVYNKHLLRGLFDSNKYEVAEFASYGLIGDKEQNQIPWKYYPNAIQGNDPRNTQYNSHGENQFGKWRLDRVLVDFKPHIVIDVRDYWMSSFEKNTGFRNYFHWILMPTIDSYPQKDEWLDTYINADAVFTYSDWGAKVLKDQTNNRVKYIGTASPAANTNVFKPVNNLQHKKQIKQALGIDPEAIIIGTVMRNQKRKLFPDLINAIENLIIKLKETNHPKANKIILYLHTSYPDAGWDFAELVSNTNIAKYIRFTYVCKKCRHIFASPFACFAQQCPRCQDFSAVIPNVANGISEESLGSIVSSFDTYIQYAICEGFGMPQIEAAMCGVPVMTMNYSAMEDVINKVGATPINIGHKFKELETGALRVYPDVSDTVDKLLRIVTRPSALNMSDGNRQRQAAASVYDWSSVVQKWIEYIDTVDINRYDLLWQQAAQANPLPEISLDEFNNNNGLYHNLYKYNKLLNIVGLDITDHAILKYLYYAEKGYIFEGPNTKNFSIVNVVQILNERIKYYNLCHQLLQMPLKTEDYITYANNQ